MVSTEGFNDKSWLDVEGHPHTEALRITERFRRRDFGHMDLDITIDDPKTFTRPFSLKIPKTFAADTELLETVCENDRSVPHMVGGVTVTEAGPGDPLEIRGNLRVCTGTPSRHHRRGRSAISARRREPAETAAGGEFGNCFRFANQRRLDRIHQGRPGRGHRVYLSRWRPRAKSGPQTVNPTS